MPRRSCLHCCINIRVENMHMLQMGQHITFPGRRGLKHINKKGTQMKWYMHHAIIKAVKIQSDFSADLVLIHFWMTNEDKKCTVTETTDSYNLSTDEIYIRKYQQIRYDPAEVVRRAESQLGNESKYNIFTYNCEHLATWCVAGEEESKQVNFCKSIMWQLVIFVIVWLFRILKPFQIEHLYDTADLLLLLYSSWYIVYRSNYFIERYEKAKIICNDCLNMHYSDLRTGLLILFHFVLLAAIFVLNFTNDLYIISTPIILALCLHILKRMILNNSYHEVKREVKKLSDINSGDVIYLNYEGTNYYIVDNSNVFSMLLHLFFFSSGTIKKHSFNLDLARHKVMYVHYPQLKTHPSDIVVQRARMRVGEKKWNWFSNRSRHFCHWAKVKEDIFYLSRKSQKKNSASPDTDVRSSLLMKTSEVWIRIEIARGDIVEIKSFGPFTDSGIVLHIAKGTHDQIFAMDVVLKKGFVKSIVKMVRFNVDLRVDRIWIHRYHPVHCYSKAKYIEMACMKIDKVCGQWTQTGFIRDCIIK
ncbi:hypothetical protein ACJMK2_029966 [Sinanodonta woodiana]|uniref:LRAT domain-containing protein n=1 Tax=Sinanodonta woodiana TaxID=1069815 RepID=A0ABD3XBT2_SINWO